MKKYKIKIYLTDGFPIRDLIYRPSSYSFQQEFYRAFTALAIKNDCYKIIYL